MNRNHTEYFGQLSAAFVILSEFELDTAKSLRIVFDGWRSIEAFDAGDEPINNLKRIFIFDGNRFNDFVSTHREIFQSISSAALNIIGVSGTDYELDYLNLQTAKLVMSLSATKRVTKDDIVRRIKTVPEYYQLITGNLELITQVVALAWEYGKENDQFLDSLTDLSELNIKI